MAGILYEPAPTPAAPPVAPVSAAPGFSPQSFRSQDDQYKDLLAQVLGTRTTGWLDGLAKVATSGFLGYQKSKNEDKADTARASAGDAYAKLLAALTGDKGATSPAGATMAPAAASAGSSGLTDALVQSRTGGVGKLPPDMIAKESGGRQFARDGKPLTSPAGAIGIAQVMPATGPEAAQLAGMPWDPQRFQNDPTYNEALGAAYYQDQMQRFGDPELARAAYNAGPGRTGQYVNGGRPLPAETVAYADMNGDGRIGGMGGGMPQQQGPQVAALGAGDMPLNPSGPQMPQSMQPGYQPIGTQAPQQMAQAAPGGQQVPGGNAQMQAALAILANPWADEGQKQVAGMILQSSMKQDQPISGIEMGNRLVNPRTGAVMADFNDQAGNGAFEGKSADIQAANYLVAQGKMTREQAAQWLLARQAVGSNGQVDLITPDALVSGQSIGGAPAVMNGQPMGGQPAAPGAMPQQPGVVTVRQPGSANLTESQGNAALYADRMREADTIIGDVGAAGQDRGQRLLNAVPVFGNSLVSSDFQQNDQAQRNFINAALRRESGAVISPDEFSNAKLQYFPQPGDRPEVLEQKRQNRLTAIQGISRAAGPAYFSAEQAATQQSPTAPQGATPPVQSGSVIRYDAQGNRIP